MYNEQKSGELIAHCLFVKSERYPRYSNYSIYYEKKNPKKNS